jgi:peflin
LRSMFSEVDRTGDGRLSEGELASALVNGDYSKFNRETVRLMIKLFDRDGDQCINFEEFCQLWKYLHEWRKHFEMFDRDRSGSINLQEFKTALDAFGYSLSPRCIGFIFQKYSRPDRRRDLAMSFDMFVQSCIVLKSIADTFKRIDTDRDGYITIGFEEFLVEVTELR